LVGCPVPDFFSVFKSIEVMNELAKPVERRLGE
jgi:hypothetical protein